MKLKPILVVWQQVNIVFDQVIARKNVLNLLAIHIISNIGGNYLTTVKMDTSTDNS